MNQKQNSKIVEVLYETSHAEFGSALEMLAACKKAKNPSLAFGYFHHSKDEYIHTKTFFSLLGKYGKSVEINE